MERSISHYKLLAEIGTGASGTVYKALDTKLERLVALKLLASHLLTDPRTRTRFIRGVQAAATLEHPAFCTVYGIDEIDGATFITMAYVSGESLADRIAAGRIDPDDCQKIVVQIATGLLAAHARGVIHRDIKPGNIMLDENGDVKILDFGLARSVKDPRIAKTGYMLGTIAYMSPEQARGEELDHRTDIWSLGVVLYEMLTGRLPFTGKDDQAILQAIRHEDPIPPDVLNPHTPAHLLNVVENALTKDRKDRYADLSDLLRDLGAKVGTMLARAPLAVEKSIAVLPFENLLSDQDNEWLSDGVTEDIITQLARIRDLKVISRTTAMRYKKTAKSFHQIAGELNVATILEGTVRQAGERLRITAQLIDAQTDTHLWAEAYDREMTDVFGVQAEVALLIADALEAHLTPAERKHVARVPMQSAKTHDLCLKGRYYWHTATPEGFKQSMAYFQQAIEENSACAEAWKGIASIYGAIGFYGYLPPLEAFPKQKVAAERALNIDPNMGEAHASMGWYKTWHEWDWDGAERFHRRALNIAPGDPLAHHNYATYLIAVGRDTEALQTIRRAIELDPLSPVWNRAEGICLYLMRDYCNASESLRRTLELDPGNVYAYCFLANTMAYRQAHAEARAMADRAVELSAGQNPYAIATAGIMHATAGRVAAAQRSLEALNSAARQTYVSPCTQAMIHVQLSNHDEAFRWLHEGLAVRDSWLTLVRADPAWDPLRKDARFRTVLQIMRLDDCP